MGCCVLVSDKETGQELALKTFRTEFLADAIARQNFEREALLWIGLGSHPAILQARWLEKFSGRYFVAMDYIAPDSDGRTNLQDYLRMRLIIDDRMALEWALQFCKGMEHAATNGIRCHRDIKPANILITSHRELKIADFGLASVQHTLSERERLAAQLCEEAGISLVVKRTREKEDLEVRRTADGQWGFSIIEQEGRALCGTPGYLAPEQFKDAAADVQSDVYVFGLVMWQMAAGSPIPPFVGSSQNIGDFLAETYHRQTTEPVPPVNHILTPAIARCLISDPSQRIRSFTEVRILLEGLHKRLTGKAVDADVRSTAASAEELSNRGGAFTKAGRWTEALECFTHALKLAPYDPLIWCNYGALLSTRGRKGEAIECFDKALEIDPQHALSISNKAGILLEQGNAAEALRLYDRALSIKPGMVNAWRNKGEALGLLGRLDAAINAYNEALRIDPNNADVLNNKGQLLANAGRLDEAMRCYDQALEIEPRSAMIWNNHAVCLGEMGKQEEAIVSWGIALDIDAKQFMAWFNKGATEDEMQRFDDAVESYDNFLRHVPAGYDNYVASVRNRITILNQRR